ncbi:MAG: SDR family oxidoreductase [Alphaproteobacteria bacterium]|nr:SDR family oxidoreductase [Alphaproteobacteria bacterium]
MTKFADRVAVITGGGSGIGQATAEALAARGARVVIADCNEAGARGVAERLKGRAYALEVSDEPAVKALAERVEREVGPVDYLLTAAGISHLPHPAEALAQRDWDQVLEVNLKGTWLSCVAFGGQMLSRRRGAIVTIASIIGMRASSMHGYGAAKAAVINLTANLAVDWGRSGVRVNCVSPGYTMTPLLKRNIQQGKRDRASLEIPTALGRTIEPEEIARPIVFLLSDDASAITGINLPIDAGWLAATSWVSYGGVRPPR